ncbi:MAG: hypothetical protein QOI71_2542, partial [Gaiellales bacterium]|nr:hypothetical protein [Gaiellales bacterium]
MFAQTAAAARGLDACSDLARFICRSISGLQNQPWLFTPAHENHVAKTRRSVQGRPGRSV